MCESRKKRQEYNINGGVIKRALRQLKNFLRVILIKQQSHIGGHKSSWCGFVVFNCYPESRKGNHHQSSIKTRMEKKKNFTTAPLPFMGQKRRFLKDFKEALKQYPDNAIYVDLFGGSGLLSHTLKKSYPNATVIYNDYDGYSDRIKNIPATNKLLADLKIILSGQPREKKITGVVRDQVLNRIKNEKRTVDYITLSSSLLFSMNYVQSFEELQADTLYNNIKKNPYDATGYLNGLTVVRADYKELFSKYRDNENVVFLVDPPYLSTEVGTYRSYWKLSDYLDVLDVLQGTSYFYFTSNKSSIIELCEWVENKTGGENPFNGASKQEVNVTVSRSASYTDIMLFKQTNTAFTEAIQYELIKCASEN